jgi:hypothetical protein
VTQVLLQCLTLGPRFLSLVAAPTVARTRVAVAFRTQTNVGGSTTLVVFLTAITPEGLEFLLKTEIRATEVQ